MRRFYECGVYEDVVCEVQIQAGCSAVCAVDLGRVGEYANDTGSIDLKHMARGVAT